MSIAYRVQHMSNGDLFGANQRLNLHIIELNYYLHAMHSGNRRRIRGSESTTTACAGARHGAPQ